MAFDRVDSLSFVGERGHPLLKLTLGLVVTRWFEGIGEQLSASDWPSYARLRRAFGFACSWVYGASAVFRIWRSRNGFQRNTRNIFPKFIRWSP
jgi:hypothetical protein